MSTVLILDGETERRRTLAALTGRIDARLRVETFADTATALTWMRWHPVDLVICACDLPDQTLSVLTRDIRRHADNEELPLVMLAPYNRPEARREVFEAGATDLVTTPVDEFEFIARISNLLNWSSQQKLIHQRARWLEQRVTEATSEIRKREHETLLRLARAGEYRDEDTGNHVLRMARYSRLIAEQLGLSNADCETIELAAPMHDIGKIGVPDHILRKPGRLTHAEFEIMKQHTVFGYEILKDSPSQYLQTGAVIALNHHERFNGTGYPNRLGGREIPLVARIVSVADAYDALTSERPYKNAWPSEKAVDYIESQRGRFFDPEIVRAFVACLEQAIAIHDAIPDQPLHARKS
ncbi:MAG TPA: HD domain-containing protein [Gammaproteobacteria bacterium]|nr:HD domain-containing protein [Gammaproteobacteria bacterium]